MEFAPPLFSAALVLRPLLRLARHRRRADLPALCDRVDASAAAVRASVAAAVARKLASVRADGSLALTLEGFALAVAFPPERGVGFEKRC